MRADKVGDVAQLWAAALVKREARIDALEALIRKATVELAIDDGPEWEWTTRCPTPVTDAQAQLIQEILNG